jgi:acetyltransferase-like isoleucine patch superfamily enzyme
VWIAANTTILKGTKICDNTVVASNSLLNKEFQEGNCIIAGSPAKVVKRIGGFKI